MSQERGRFSAYQSYQLEINGVGRPQLRSFMFPEKGGLMNGFFVCADIVDEIGKINSLEEDVTTQVSLVQLPLREIGVRDTLGGILGWNSVIANLKKARLEVCPMKTGLELVRSKTELALRQGQIVDIISNWFTGDHGFQLILSLRRPEDGTGIRLDTSNIDGVWTPDTWIIAKLP